MAALPGKFECDTSQMADISFLCKRTVVSTKPVQPGKFYPLSVLDHIMEPCNLRILYYYRFPSETVFGETTRKLRESLAEMLTSYPIVTGRLQKTPEGHWKIKCNDAGVRMVEARATGSVEEWLQTADRDQELKLIYWEDMFYKPYFWSTFYIQMTEFEGGGIAIGLSCTHLLADAACATLLVKAWADTTMFGKMLSPPDFHPLSVQRVGNEDANYDQYDNLINCHKSSLENANDIMALGSQKYATISFAFSDEMVKKCMAECLASDGTADDTNSTPFTALASLFWLSVSKVKGKERGLVNMSLCLDRRNVLGLGKGFFGNCMIFNKVCVEGLTEGGLVKAATAINKVMQKTGNKEIMDFLEWSESKRSGNVKSDDQSPVPINAHNLVCANWENVDPYTSVFESGVKPIRVSYYFEPVFGQGQVLILPSPNESDDGSLSRVVMVTLPEQEMVKLCDETCILQFCPTILMGMNKHQG